MKYNYINFYIISLLKDTKQTAIQEPMETNFMYKGD